MKTERGKFQYGLPEDCNKVSRVMVLVGGYLYELSPLSMSELAEAIKKSMDRNGSPVWAFPVYFATDGELFCLYPVPDEEYEVTVRYFPHIKVW